MRVDGERRAALRANHSATHLLHAALRRQLGEHVTQKGSLVAPDRLRFDISQPKAIGDDELAAVESEVNGRIRGNSVVTTVQMSPDEAVEAGAMALFGEKYGDEVRVVAMGDDAEERYSVELCGGTHVHRTGDIGFFKIVSEGAVAAGVRRIEALSGAAAIAHAGEQERLLKGVAAVLKTTPEEAGTRVAALLDERKRLERELTETRRKLATGGAAEGPAAKEIAGVRFIGQRLDGVAPRDLKGMVDDLKKSGPGVYALVAVNDGKASLVVGVSDELCGQLNAVDLVKAGSLAVGGKGGGGRPDMAQAGGPDGDKADQAIAAIESELAAG
jgi:alanyl-tRNA synthetase